MIVMVEIKIRKLLIVISREVFVFVYVDGCNFNVNKIGNYNCNLLVMGSV